MSSSSQWQEDVLAQLKLRNQTQSLPFIDIYQQTALLMDENITLLHDRTQSAFQNARLNDELRRFEANAVDSETVKLMEKKLLAAQEELTELHRRKGENAQLVIDTSAKVAVLEEKASAAASEAEASMSKLKVSTMELLELKQKLDELYAANQLLRDEYQTNQLTLSATESELLAVQRENKGLIGQLIELKEKDVKRLNDENDTFKMQKRLQLQQQLEDAARDQSCPVSKQLPQSIRPLQSDVLDLSITCERVCVPNRVYMRMANAHDGDVNALNWSQNGNILYSGGSDRRIKMWDISHVTGRTEVAADISCKQLSGSNGAIMSLTTDAGNALILAASSDYASRIWTINDGRLRHTLTGHSGKVLSSKFFDNYPNRVASGSYDRTLRLWDLKSRRCVSTLFAGSGCNDLVTVDAMLISGHIDKKVRFWDIRTSNTHSNCIQETLLNGKITSLDLSPNGFWLLACTRDDDLKLIDLRNTSEVAGTFTAQDFRVGCDFTRSKFSPNSEYVCAGSVDGSIYIWRTDPPYRLETVLSGEHGDSNVIAVSWRPTRNGLVTCDKNKMILLWAKI